VIDIIYNESMPYKLKSTEAGIASPDNPARRFLAAKLAISTRVSNVALPMWGKTTHLHQNENCQREDKRIPTS
jgi:hypothetical protein